MYGTRVYVNGELVGSLQVPRAAGQESKPLDVCIPIEGCRCWSPEDPFLYKLEVATPGDRLCTRFGTRLSAGKSVDLLKVF